MEKNQRLEFQKWLSKVEFKANKTAESYGSAINSVSKYFSSHKNKSINIYSINDPNIVESIAKEYFSMEEAKKVNKKAHNRLSCALESYYKFLLYKFKKEKIKEKAIENNENIEIKKKEKPKCKIKIIQESWPRDIKVAEEIKKVKDYVCEIDEDHKYFLGKESKKNYVEAHHLIPMKFQEKFKYSIDVLANMICLCPVCHKKLHNGLLEEKEKLLNLLYLARKENLKKSGIGIEFQELLKMYETI